MGAREGGQILRLIGRLQQRGDLAIILIAHNYSQVMDVCDRVNLLQHGEITFDRRTAQTSVAELLELVHAEYRIGLVNPPRIAMNSLSRRQALAAAALAAEAWLSCRTGRQRGGRLVPFGRPPRTAAADDQPGMFGQINGAAVHRYTLTAANGLTVRILTYGGIVQSVQVPDGRGHPVDIALGFATLDQYVAHNSPEAGEGCILGC